MENTTDTWPVQQIRIDELTLDHRNPRFPDKYSNASQEELIHILINESDVFDLAKEIVQRQDVPQWEKIFIAKEDGKNIVLEGNRRISAYKCLLKPELAPKSYQEKFKSLSKKIRFNQNKEVDVIVAPNRMAAAPIIQSKHTNKAMKEWTPAMKDRFIDRMNSGSSSPPKAEYKARILQANLYALATKLYLPDNIKEIVQDHNKFSVTNLKRVAGGTLGRAFLDYKIDESGKIIPANKLEFDKKFKKIVSDVAEGKITSRLGAQNKEELQKYFLTFDLPTQKNPNTAVDQQANNKPSILKTNVTKDEPIKTPTQTQINIPFAIPNSSRKPLSISSEDAIKITDLICERFSEVVLSLKTRNRTGRDSLTMNDEYDVQYLMKALLNLFFDDVRREEPTESYATGSTRMDLLLYKDEIVVEAKFATSSLTDKKLKEQFILDIAHYKKHSRCKTLFFYIFDSSRLVMNFAALKTEIENESTRKLKIKVKMGN